MVTLTEIFVCSSIQLKPPNSGTSSDDKTSVTLFLLILNHFYKNFFQL